MNIDPAMVIVLFALSVPVVNVLDVLIESGVGQRRPSIRGALLAVLQTLFALAALIVGFAVGSGTIIAVAFCLLIIGLALIAAVIDWSSPVAGGFPRCDPIERGRIFEVQKSLPRS